MQIERVLMVDDDASIRKIGELCLSKVGKWQVLMASSGQEALDIGPAFNPDVIILDVMMPGMDGPTTFKLLQENAAVAKTPVIFMTAKVQTHEVEGYSTLGAAGVIGKPFDPMKLPEEIGRILAKANY
ncbi:MAG: response regulator [Cyanobacteria bacterium SZAS LIN-2]|nr:response regulator [Cyanobacteria bacterium SZAS LIN-3]MBS1995681.1 response regulator [Cyanobacteria bacterium SZAS LIN-2]